MGSKSKQTSTNTLDPQYSSLVYGNADRANNLANNFQPYSGQLTAGFNDAQREAQQGILNFTASKTGSGLLGQATDAATQGGAYSPLNVYAQQVGQQAGITPQQIQAGQLSSTDLTPYYNPFQANVIDATAAQYDRQNQIDLNNARGRAASAGAFGGSGSALLQSQAQEANNRNWLQTVAGLNSQNFNQAQGAAQFDIGNRMAAAQANQGADLTGQQFNSSANLQRLLANQSADLNAQQANQQAGLSSNAQRLQASGILSGLSDQQRAQALQDWQLESAVGDTQQQQQQAALDAQHNAYLEWLNTQIQGQGLANSGVGLVPQLVNNTQITKTSPGFAEIAGGLAKLGITAAPGGASLGLGGLTAGLGGILGRGAAGAASAAAPGWYGSTAADNLFKRP